MAAKTVDRAVASLRKKATTRTREGLARYGIAPPKAMGVAMGDIQALGKQVGRDHALAAALWKTGWYEARLLCAYVDEPIRVTPAQMDRWCRDFDNWAICDTLCFALFDRTPHAWDKVAAWSRDEREFVKRAAFALLAALAGHDKRARDEQFLAAFPLIERGAADGRNFVKKAVSWALRRIGGRSAGLHKAALQLAQALADSPGQAERWVGRDALRDLRRPMVAARVAGKSAGKAKSRP